MVNLVRDGKLVWPYCNECGCRLDLAVTNDWVYMAHYGRGLIDPRGHGCSLVLKHEWFRTGEVYQGVV